MYLWFCAVNVLFNFSILTNKGLRCLIVTKSGERFACWLLLVHIYFYWSLVALLSRFGYQFGFYRNDFFALLSFQISNRDFILIVCMKYHFCLITGVCLSSRYIKNILKVGCEPSWDWYFYFLLMSHDLEFIKTNIIKK